MHERRLSFSHPLSSHNCLSTRAFYCYNNLQWPVYRYVPDRKAIFSTRTSEEGFRTPEYLEETPHHGIAAASTAVRLPENTNYFQKPSEYIITVRPDRINEGFRTLE